MRVRGVAIQQVLLGAALLVALLWNLAHAAEIKQLRLTTGPTGTHAELRLDAVVEYRMLSLANPDRLVLDLPDSHLSRGASMPAPTGIVSGVRSGQPSPGMIRIVFDLAAPVTVLKPRIQNSVQGSLLVLEWPDDGPALATATASQPALSVAAPAAGAGSAAMEVSAETGKAAALAAGVPATVAPATPHQAPQLPATATPQQAPQLPTTAAPAPAPVKSMHATGITRTLVIAIDPGHGGKDTGAIGPDGTREKDITLAIGRELARQINATPGLKAYLTRDSDYFIPLPQRARKAHAAHADIFISIHADSSTSPAARGAGVFVLSTRGASSQRARWLADKENAADVIGGDHAHTGDNVLTSVLLDLTQSGNMKASEAAAEYVLGNLDAIGNVHRGEVEHANFAVLRTSDNMPAMLVETGFVSNPQELARLVSKDYQRQVAAAIFNGINRHFTQQPPPGTLYAQRAANASGGGDSSASNRSP